MDDFTPQLLPPNPPCLVSKAAPRRKPQCITPLSQMMKRHKDPAPNAAAAIRSLCSTDNPFRCKLSLEEPPPLAPTATATTGLRQHPNLDADAEFA